MKTARWWAEEAAAILSATTYTEHEPACETAARKLAGVIGAVQYEARRAAIADVARWVREATAGADPNSPWTAALSMVAFQLEKYPDQVGRTKAGP